MGLPPSNIQQTREHAAGSVRSAIQGEIEALVLGRMESAGGRLAELARFRSFVGEVLGVYGTVTDIIDMAVAGYEAMTIQRRMLMRVSAAHGFGYWIFKNPNIISPLNPPNSFLVLQRGLDQSDQSIGRRIGNSDFSTDGGLTANDWNSIWRRGVQETFRNLESGMRRMAQTGKLRRTLQERMGDAAAIHGQTHEESVNQYRYLFLAPGFGSPATAAGGFFLSSLQRAGRAEREANLRLYRQFPYNPNRSQEALKPALQNSAATYRNTYINCQIARMHRS